ncbi:MULTISPECIES: 5-oxoprolinase/urea amidolyase family protein [unclassified Agrococcus]|uniref:5-oxoprolinase subunit B/C family protein n=1 Tax=unclassified Agrococcus TaxID=2615065 RepID=UPI00360B71A4
MTDVHRLGTRAVLARVPSASVDAVRTLLEAEPLPGQLEVAAGGASVTVRFATLAHADAGRSSLARLQAPAGQPSSGGLVTIDVVYDGEDLDDVAAATGRSVEAVVRAHAGASWHVAFVGFAPGFAYLRADRDGPVVPRRSSPRARVPAGAVALAGSYSAVYPRSSPGGWQLVGRTDARLWSLERDEPTLLPAGTRVDFRAVRAQARAAEAQAAPLPRVDAAERPPHALVVRSAGAQTLVEDLGRAGLAHLGIARSGAADRGALRQANRLVGNVVEAAAIEHVGGGLRIEAAGEHVLAVTGAAAPLVVRSPRGDRSPAPAAPFALRDGDALEVAAVRGGLRVVVGVRGGVDVPAVLGSRSTDVLSGLGPPPVRAGDVLPVGRATAQAVGAPEPLAGAGAVAARAADGEDGEGDVVLDVVLGPDDAWIPDAAATLAAATWIVTPQSNRVGVRLDGPPIARRDGELESQALVPGAIQVPPSGLPVVFLADHPATGGYPVVAVVADDHLDALAQLAPGTAVRLRPASATAPGAPGPTASQETA